jgi:hypothetical protein
MWTGQEKQIKKKCHVNSEHEKVVAEPEKNKFIHISGTWKCTLK